MKPTPTTPACSIVVPIYNEEGAIAGLHREIKEALARLGKSAEVIYVNDGSTDGSLLVLKSLEGAKIIDLNRRYGQATALDAGFKAAAGDIVVSLDGDGQNDPKDIPALVGRLEGENLDMVAGWRTERQDPRTFRLLTRIGRSLRRLLIADTVHDSGCTLRAYRKAVVKSLDLGGEMHRYIVAIVRWKGFRIGEMAVSHRPRLHGKSHYRGGKAVRGFLDLVYVWFIHKYSQRPVHLFGYLSLLVLAASAVSLGLSIFQKISDGLSLNRNAWFFVAFFLLLTSVIFFSIGVMLDFIIRLHLNNSPYEKRYYVREVIER